MPPRKTRAKTTAAAAESPAKVVDTEEEVAEVEVAESKKASTRAKRGRSASATSAADAADAADAVDAAAPPLMFGSFTNPQAFTAMEQKYEDLGGLGHRPLMALVQSYLTDYNLSRADGGMNLVLFMYCVEHVVRVCRVLRQPGGNALLVGVGVSAIYCMYIYDTFLMPVGCTRCVTSSTCTDNTMNIQARITLNVECRRGGIFICVFDV